MTRCGDEDDDDDMMMIGKVISLSIEQTRLDCAVF
jgi:hypothetical protein